MKTMRKVVVTALWVLSVAGVCFGASLPLPQYPVLFIHGINSDASTWADLRDLLINHGWTYGGSPRFMKATNPTNDYVTGASAGDFYTMNMSDYADPYRSQNLTFEQQGYELGMVVGRVKAVTGQPKVILVGHSMGGLAARAYLEGLGFWDPARRMSYGNDVANLVTVGTPNLGSPLAEILPYVDALWVSEWFLGISAGSIALAELDPTSSAFNILNNQPLPDGVHYASIVSWSRPALAY